MIVTEFKEDNGVILPKDTMVFSYKDEKGNMIDYSYFKPYVKLNGSLVPVPRYDALVLSKLNTNLLDGNLFKNSPLYGTNNTYPNDYDSYPCDGVTGEPIPHEDDITSYINSVIILQPPLNTTYGRFSIKKVANVDSSDYRRMVLYKSYIPLQRFTTNGRVNLFDNFYNFTLIAVLEVSQLIDTLGAYNLSLFDILLSGEYLGNPIVNDKTGWKSVSVGVNKGAANSIYSLVAFPYGGGQVKMSSHGGLPSTSNCNAIFTILSRSGYLEFSLEYLDGSGKYKTTISNSAELIDNDQSIPKGVDKILLGPKNDGAISVKAVWGWNTALTSTEYNDAIKIIKADHY